MNFAEQLEADVEAVFLNPEEFGEQVELGGRKICVVMREGAEVDNRVSDSFSPAVLEPVIPERLVTIHAATKDIASEVSMGRSVTLNGIRHAVLFRSGANEAMTRLILERQGY